MKVFSTLFLLLALATMLYMNVGQVGGVYMGISEARKEASQNLKNQELSTIVISQGEVQTGKVVYVNEKEILYNGKLYDIASSVNRDGTVILKVFHDEKEEGLLANLKDVVEGWLNTPRSTKQHSSKQVFSIKDFIPAQKFTFNYNLTFEHLFIAAPVPFAESPLLAVLKSPPQLG